MRAARNYPGTGNILAVGAGGRKHGLRIKALTYCAHMRLNRYDSAVGCLVQFPERRAPVFRTRTRFPQGAKEPGYQGSLLHPSLSYDSSGDFWVVDFLIGLVFVLMVVGPAILASIQKNRSHDPEN